MTNAETLNDALLIALKDIYSSEKQILKALPLMAEKASNPKLKEAFELHIQETQVQIERLDEISEILGKKLTGKVCKATKGLIEEGNEVLEQKQNGENDHVIDSMLISAARRVEHYEIASYCSAMQLANALELSRVFIILRETFAEESKTDSALKILAKKKIIPLAMTSEIEHSEPVEMEATV